MHSGYIPVIGLEIHAQLASQSKIFCPDPVGYGETPNAFVSPISLGHPGTLPTLNEECVSMAVRMGLALNCEVNRECHFARKNYFYPDLPKGYQISQDDTPVCGKGQLPIRLEDGTERWIGITRIHMEEDAGKNLHDQDIYDSLIDYNRCGTGLIEIVSEPDLRTTAEAMAYVTEIRKIVRYIGISDGNMEEGNLRVDANISVMKEGSKVFGTRAEVKNINSISNLGRAITYEANRQIELLEAGEELRMQTRNWDSVNGQTTLLREKETADDYRYFPEPDLQPLVITDEMLEQIKAQLPALPRERFQRYTQEFGLPAHDATLLTEFRAFAEYFEAVLEYCTQYKAVSNWLNGPVKNYLNEHAVSIDAFPLAPKRIAELQQLVDGGQVSHSVAKETLFNLMLAQPATEPETLAREHNLILDITEDQILTEIHRILAENPDKVNTYLNGKTGLLGFFVGQVMKAFQGKADPKQINQLLSQELEKQKDKV
jgi:aspartyl-tRNA(Asn)/glutamyl-tRNA(Gln) amidotransferase subunit B